MLLTLFNHAWPLAFYFLFAYWTEFQQATSLHHPSIYAHIHKKHHKYTIPFLSRLSMRIHSSI
ncbi:uncharacterized protein K441DRAFT_664782 [Cenococcum geophilum 1.58]|uniref:uncharacterized protein n=1 Tax=Cenococcum geophilum 1.58 TaxID=794803 RepID=UPI00358DFA90|nr:hypothetical protein K441DRAFT_664782 [Cenococcum geophilum 1.58]